MSKLCISVYYFYSFVDEHTEELHRLMVRNNISENNIQQLPTYMVGYDKIYTMFLVYTLFGQYQTLLKGAGGRETAN